MAEFNAFEAPFCNHTDPTKICPFCLHCSCEAPEEYQRKFWEDGPRQLKEEKWMLENRSSLRLGELLIKAGKLTRGQLMEVIEKQRETKRKFGEVIVMMNLLTPEELELYLMDQKWIDEIDLKEIKADFPLIDKVGRETCARLRMIPFEIIQMNDQEILRVAVESQRQVAELKKDEDLRHYKIIPYIAKGQDIDEILIQLSKREDTSNMLILEEDRDDEEG
jgi:hypothetical protein